MEIIIFSMIQKTSGKTTEAKFVQILLYSKSSSVNFFLSRNFTHVFFFF